METLKHKATSFLPIYCVAFFLGLYFSIPAYINSSFLNYYIPEKLVGFVYTLASLATLLLLPQLPKLLSLWGNYKTTIVVLAIGGASVVSLVFSEWALLIIPLFVLYQISLSFGLFSLDVFTEARSENVRTGTIRGSMLTAINIAVLAGPLIAGMIVVDGNFDLVFLASALTLFPALFIVSKYFKGFVDPKYRHATFWKTLGEVLSAKHPYDTIRHAILGDFLLRFFFAWMVIYTPIYLYKHIGFAWNEIGLVMAVALLPYVLFELPAGKLMDKKLHEKYVMGLGFLIAAIFTASIFIVDSKSLLVWALLLFGTRVGASFIEISSESYFFKHIDKTDVNILSVFRNTQPLAYVVGPILASAILVFLPMHYLFGILAGFLVLGIINSFLIPKRGSKETRE